MPKGPQLVSGQGLLQGFLTGQYLQLRKNHRVFARWFSNLPGDSGNLTENTVAVKPWLGCPCHRLKAVHRYLPPSRGKTLKHLWAKALGWPATTAVVQALPPAPALAQLMAWGCISCCWILTSSGFPVCRNPPCVPKVGTNPPAIRWGCQIQTSAPV